MSLPIVGPRAVLAGALALLILPASCKDAAHEPSTLKLVGSSTIAPIASEIAKLYEAAHPGVRIEVQGGGSGRGLNEVRAGLCDIGLVSRALKADEADVLEVPIARDGVGFIVHASRRLDGLDAGKVRAIYRGEVKEWSALAAGAGPIHVVHKAQGRSTQEVFLEHFGLKETEIRPSVVIGDNLHGLKTVAGDPSAIGYVSIGAAEEEIRAGAPIRLLALEGVPASSEAVRDGRYPFSRSLVMVVRREHSELARDWLDFVRSPGAADVFRRFHVISLQP